LYLGKRSRSSFLAVSGVGAGAAGCSAESDVSVFTDVEFPISEMNGNNIRSGTGRPRVDYIHQ
jgi:hypothetical protein